MVAAWSANGKPAVAQCPSGYRVIAGGSSSSDGSSVGTGIADLDRNAWVVKRHRGARAEAFASCVRSGAAATNFEWRVIAPFGGLAAARCPERYDLVAGYATGPVSTSWVDRATQTYWVTGGGTAHASCVVRDAGVLIRHAWNQSQEPKAVFAGCGAAYTVVGGAMGDDAWPGPPIQEHPGVALAPNVFGRRGWWTFGGAANELTWAACVKTTD
jgi:hypothetical protein